MFQVNRRDAGGRYIDAEGDYTVTVAKVEETLDAKGREVCKVTFKTEDGASITDRYINQENVWFRVNQLVAATKHNVPDGTEYDFLGVKGSYAAFLKSMTGLELLITARSEEYMVNGETKRTLRIKNMREVPIAEVDGDELDPKPF
jgi:hypothetical protein